MPGAVIGMTAVALARNGRPVTERSVLAAIEERYGAVKRGRARMFPDTDAVIRQAVAEMKRDGTNEPGRTWRLASRR